MAIQLVYGSKLVDDLLNRLWLSFPQRSDDITESFVLNVVVQYPFQYLILNVPLIATRG